MGQKLHRCIGTGIATLLTAWTVVPASSADDVRVDEIRVNQGRIEHRIQALSEFGRNPEGGVSRVAYSDADIQGRAYVKTLMEQAGLAVRVDAGGNIIGRREGTEPTLPPIMFGSHIDSVPGGGNYDGHLGSIAAIEVAQTLADHGIVTRHPLEVIIFADEEGGLVGSRALAGRLSAKALETVSHSGFTIREGIRRIGGDPDALGDPRWSGPARRPPFWNCISNRARSSMKKVSTSASSRASSASAGGTSPSMAWRTMRARRR